MSNTSETGKAQNISITNWSQGQYKDWSVTTGPAEKHVVRYYSLMYIPLTLHI